jgi:trehalose-6-phosphate synthase
MRAMRKTVLKHDVAAWATSFLEGLSDEGTRHHKAVRTP